jgi:FkbM family methyltransferase
MSLLGTMQFIWGHPLACRQRARAFERYVRWQVGSRVSPGPVVVDFVNDARLLVRPGMTGATGNVYAGLHEFEDMAFVLHVLRPDDLFVDVGANVGTYTLLATAAVGARCIAYEPIPAAFAALRDNVRLNGVLDRVILCCAAVGRTSGSARMTTQLDSCNHVAAAADGAGEPTMEVPVVALDDVDEVRDASVVKIDVEGFEPAVLAGAERLLASPRLQAVLMETNQASRAYGTPETEAHEVLLARGFQSFTYSPFERRLVPLQGRHKPNANTLYLREAAKVEARVREAERFAVLGEHV